MSQHVRQRHCRSFSKNTVLKNMSSPRRWWSTATRSGSCAWCERVCLSMFKLQGALGGRWMMRPCILRTQMDYNWFLNYLPEKSEKPKCIETMLLIRRQSPSCPTVWWKDDMFLEFDLEAASNFLSLDWRDTSAGWWLWIMRCKCGIHIDREFVCI